jgi:hypothetical protein
MDALPNTEQWDLSRMSQERQCALQIGLSVPELAERISRTASVQAPMACDAHNRAAPPRTARAMFAVDVRVDVCDLFYNGMAGVRAHYWASAELGDEATAVIIRSLEEQLLRCELRAFQTFS